MRFFNRPSIVEAPPEPSAAEKFEAARREIVDADAAVRAADVALSKYLQVHPNAHRIQRIGNKSYYRLNAMVADLSLTQLERVRDEAKERFQRALEVHANLKDSQEVHYVAGQRV